MSQEPPTIEHAGMLEDLAGIPAYLLPEPAPQTLGRGPYSCSYCGVGDSGVLESSRSEAADATVTGKGELRITMDGRSVRFEATLDEQGYLTVATDAPLAAGGMLSGEFLIDGRSQPITARPADEDKNNPAAQRFLRYSRSLSSSESRVTGAAPTSGCVKLKLSMMRQRPAYPIHTAPSVLENGVRRGISYPEAIARFADLLLAHRPPQGNSLIYACGQLDYFSIFAVQEVFRLLGVRNLTGNAEHCLNAGAVHTEILTGQESPFLTVQQGVEGANRVYILNGWNGLITHPPVFRAIMKRPDLDAFLIEVMVTESAVELARKLGPERVLLIRPRSDAHLALAVAHEILAQYPEAVERRFIDRFSEPDSFDRFAALAASPLFEPERAAERIAPEPQYATRLHDGIRGLAYKLAQPETVPINLPSVGLSQTSGVVAHCLWGCVLAMLGKFGLRPDGEPAGGTLRVPGQINAETEVQGLSRKYFMGRIPMDQATDAARRMGLPEDAYETCVRNPPRAALDYSDPTPDTPELFICLGTQFEANMMNRPRWLRKLNDPHNTLVVIDPVPDPYSLAQADLIIPSPPHPATTKLYQNGEWKMSLSVPHKQAPAETRSDPTILYDLMAEIGRRLATDSQLAAAHPDLARHVRSGYIDQRFGCGLLRRDGEVSRPQLWQRIMDYMGGGCGPLYCRPEHADGRPVAWEELLTRGSVIYGGVGTHRYRLDYDGDTPFADIFRRPRKFRFFTPTEQDLRIPHGIILNSGRSPLSDDRRLIQFATSTFNSGKATPTVNMPEDNPCHVSPLLAQRLGLKTGDTVRMTGRYNGATVDLPVVVTDRVKGETVYVSFHKSRAQMDRNVYINDLTHHLERCPYCAQVSVKANQVFLERVEAHAALGLRGTAAPAIIRRREDLRLDTTLLDPKLELPVWTGQGNHLYVADIVEETHDVYTFRFQGDPLCRFVYWPGQFCTLILNIDGKKVVRSYTISSSPTRPFLLEVTIKRVPGGLVSNWLPDNLKVGDRVEIAGPKGKFYLAPGKVPPKILLVSAGSGVTPMLSMARWLCDVAAEVDVRFFNSVRSPRDIIYHKEIDWITSRYKQFHPVITTSSRESGAAWSGYTGRVSRAMLEMACPDIHERHIYLCGPAGFMETVEKLLDDMGFDSTRLHSESFGGIRTSIANKSAPGGADGAETELTAAESAAPAGDITVEFARTGAIAKTDGSLPLLDLAEAYDVDLDYGCRTGACGDCKARLLEGEVDQGSEEGLEPKEREAGYILTCVARPKGHSVIDV